jgi:ribosomal protein S18 acetylase RimI-like enzyme
VTGFDLRPATDRDYELLWTIQRIAIGPYVDATWGSDEAFQRRYFDEHFDPRRHQVVVVDGADAGFLSFERRGDHVYLGNVALLPAYQRRGIGAAIVQHVIEQANAAGLPVRLQVLRSNPARRFYERLGFESCGETATHFQLIRKRDPG